LSEAVPLWQWSACDLAAAISAGDVSSLEAVGSVVDRVRATNHAVNAIVDDLGDDALRQAEEHDRTLRHSGPIGPLHGVPVTVKENVDQKGRATPNGVKAFAGIIAPDDAPVVRNLLDAGAIVVGRTNTPEFSFRATTVNELHGRTFNPWNDHTSAGGSSGGAAAATMMGYGPLGHGNDIGGSLRFPAYCCGAATVKPGLGRVPAYNPSAAAERGILAQLMSVQGLIGREVRDVRLGMRCLVRYDPRDPWQVPMPFDGPREQQPKVAFTKNTFEFELHPAVSTALDNAREALTKAGYQVEDVEPPLLRETAEHAVRCLFGETKLLMGPDIAKHGSTTVNAVFEEYYRQFPPFEGEELVRAMAQRNRFIRAWTVFLDDYPLVLTPFLPAPPFEWNRDEQGAEGVREVLGAAVYSYSMNLMGLPAACVPAHFDEGLPIGVQIVGRRFREDQILDAAEVVEQSAGVMAQRLWQAGGLTG
jgi:amidase